MEDLPFTTTDIAVLVGIGLFGLLATFWGFVGLVTGIGAWVGALIITIMGYPYAQEFSSQYIENQLFADVAAGGGLFAGALVLLMIVSSILSHLAKESALGPINRALGFVAGIGVGYLACCIILLVAVLLFEESSIPESVQNSRSYELVRTGGVAILEALPEGVGNSILRKMEQGRQAVEGLQMIPAIEDGSGPEAGYSAQDNDQMNNAVDQTQ